MEEGYSVLSRKWQCFGSVYQRAVRACPMSHGGLLEAREGCVGGPRVRCGIPFWRWMIFSSMIICAKHSLARKELYAEPLEGPATVYGS